MQRIESSLQTTIHDLRPGDIFIFNFYGVPHTGIYAPTPGGQGDIIHMYFDKERTGAIKSTLSKILMSGSEVYIFRSNKLDGNAIAAQAHFWLNQGIEYDKPRLAQSLYSYTDEETSEEYNIKKYLLIAARRETMPIKVHQFPCPPASMITDIGISMLLPDFTYCQPLSYVGSRFAMYGADDPDRPKGMTCVTFVLSCLAAVALKDEIQPVSADTGWISLKHSSNQNEIYNLVSKGGSKNLDFDRLRDKLTPELAKIDPHKPSPFAFYDALRNDEDNWEFVGTVDNTIVKEFDKQVYRQEQLDLAANIKANRQKFIDAFGEEIFNRQPERPYRHFTLFNDKTSENPPVQDNAHEVSSENISP